MFDIDEMVNSLRRGAKECGCAEQAGWGNTMADAAELISYYQARVQQLEGLAERTEDLLLETISLAERALTKDLDVRMCCSGDECGCRGSTWREESIWLLNQIEADAQSIYQNENNPISPMFGDPLTDLHNLTHQHGKP